MAFKYSLNWCLNRCQFISKKFEFVSVDILVQGNSSAKPKINRLKKSIFLKTATNIIVIIGFANFNVRWIPRFKTHTSILCNFIYKSLLDDAFPQNLYMPKNNRVYNILKMTSLKILFNKCTITKQIY